MKVKNSAIWQAGLIGAVLATVLNLVVLAIGSAAGVSFLATTMGQAVNVLAVVVTSLLAMVAGTALAVLLNRWGRLRVAQVVGGVVAVVSTGAIFTAGFDASAALLLAVMHLLTGAVYVGALQRARGVTSTGSGQAEAATEAARS